MRTGKTTGAENKENRGQISFLMISDLCFLRIMLFLQLFSIIWRIKFCEANFDKRRVLCAVNLMIEVDLTSYNKNYKTLRGSEGVVICL